MKELIHVHFIFWQNIYLILFVLWNKYKEENIKTKMPTRNNSTKMKQAHKLRQLNRKVNRLLSLKQIGVLI